VINSIRYSIAVHMGFRDLVAFGLNTRRLNFNALNCYLIISLYLLAFYGVVMGSVFFHNCNEQAL